MKTIKIYLEEIKRLMDEGRFIRAYTELNFALVEVTNYLLEDKNKVYNTPSKNEEKIDNIKELKKEFASGKQSEGEEK